MRTPGSRDRGFTLIELLVVVAIIALLISILLPSLARAREQTKIVKCTANMRSVSTALVSYGHENTDYPWSLRRPVDNNLRYNFSVWSALVYAGAIPDKTNYEFNQAGLNLGAYSASSIDVYRVPPRLRPLNRYISPEVSWDCEPNPAPLVAREVPSETPDFFKCPADKTPWLPLVEGSNPPKDPDAALPAWAYWGSSYPLNWFWGYYYAQAAPGNQPPYAGGNQFLKILGSAPPPETTASLGALMLRAKDGRFASEFVVFTDNDMTYTLEGGRPPTYNGPPWNSQQRRVVGWHGGFSKHAAAFLDGHALYRTFDTRYILGDGWTVWPNKPWTDTWEPYNDKAPTP